MKRRLYSLEYLKAARKINGSVLFCHVPPLGSKLTKTKRVTEDYVEHFAKDLLETWRDADQDPQPPEPTALAAVGATAAASATAAQDSPEISARERK